MTPSACCNPLLPPTPLILQPTSVFTAPIPSPPSPHPTPPPQPPASHLLTFSLEAVICNRQPSMFSLHSCTLILQCQLSMFNLQLSTFNQHPNQQPWIFNMQILIPESCATCSLQCVSSLIPLLPRPHLTPTICTSDMATDSRPSVPCQPASVTSECSHSMPVASVYHSQMALTTSSPMLACPCNFQLLETVWPPHEPTYLFENRSGTTLAESLGSRLLRYSTLVASSSPTWLCTGFLVFLAWASAAGVAFLGFLLDLVP